MDIFLSILPILVTIVFCWLFFVNISLIFSFRKHKQKDKTLTLCINQKGLIFYCILGIIYIGICTIGVFFAIININSDLATTLAILNISTIATIGVTYFFGQITYIGSRQMIIGKAVLDYRKIKRVTYPKESKVRFIYGQKSYETSLRFLDESRVKQALQRCR